ncbi:cytochrome P450 [Hypoxylon sp. FL1857]|nr:cytochrome P450 [Hypoxylon sp. FL1857]
MDILDTLPDYVANIIFTVITCLCLVLAYRLLLHPLKNFPGPILARLSDCYGTFFALRRDLHLATFRDHQQYGPVIRQGPNKLVFNTVTAFRDIHQNERVTKSHLYLLGSPSLRNKGVFVSIDRDAHRSRRKLISQAISERSMRNFEPVMIAQVDIFLRRLLLSTQSSEPEAVNMSEYLRYLTFDVVSLLSFGRQFHLQTSSKNRFILQSIEYLSWHANVLLQLPLLSWFKTETILNLLFLKMQLGTYRLLVDMIKQRMVQDKDASQDLYSFIAESLKPGPKEKLDQSALWNEATFFLQAGSDTTSTCLSATFFYLSRNKRCYEELAREVRSTFNSGSEIRSGPTLAKCHYLRACIDEALRMSPSVPGTLWREQYADDKAPGPLIIDGHLIPRGTQVGVNIYALHHNEEYFPDSFSYKLERWIAPTGAPTHDAFAAFLTGPRGCAGKAMAYLEASLVLAKTIWYFDFEPASGELGKIGMGRNGNTRGRNREGEFQIYDIFTATSDGPYLKFRPRGHHWKDLDEDTQKVSG